jgi:NADPH:quinone reductase-like Zn-dependent oxidoreductase
VTVVTQSPIVRTVRAVVFDRYGRPEVLRIEQIEKPAPKDDEALVRVHAASATRSDCGLRGAEYFVGRLFTGLVRPRSDRRRVGLEFAGRVEAVGAAVTEFAAGDRLFGICSGGNAEYVCVAQGEAIARIPDGIGFEKAAGVADGGLSAISLLRSAGLEQGGRIAINGASGSIGVGGVQVAKHLGAHVTAVCSTRAVDLMRSLGADEVVDYEHEDFTKNGETYDVVLDAAGKTTYGRCRRSLSTDGVYITTDPGFLWRDAFVALVSRRAKLGIVRYTKADIETLAGLLAAGEYRPVIDRTYPLEDVVEAHRYVETHQKVGNVVLTLVADR